MTISFLAVLVALISSAAQTSSFMVKSTGFGVSKISISTRQSITDVVLLAEIRGPTEKSENLRFGWDGKSALGGAIEVAAPCRMLDNIRAAGETQSDACELFNANLEMSGDDLMFEDFITLCDEQYEYGLIQFKNGDITNQSGENGGSAKVLSYAALANFDKETTLKLWGQYYRDVLATPDGDDHQNIRNFMKYGWEGVPFENGIALTKKKLGDDDWDAFSESWIP